MRYFPLIWSILWSKRIRTALTFVSIVAAFLLFGILQGINAAFQQAVDRSNVDRLVVTDRISLTDPLPYEYLEQISHVRGVAKVSHETWFGAYFRDPRNFIVAYPVEAEREFPLYPKFLVSRQAIAALQHTRTGAIVGEALARKYGWHVGDRVPLRSTIWVNASGSSDWQFDIVGIYHNPDDRSREDTMYLNYDYFDGARTFGKGTVGWYVVQVQDPSESARVAQEIDTLFRNSPFETHTQTEKEFQQAFLKQIGDIQLIVTYIIVAVFFALLFSVGATVTQSLREQVPYLAVLKTMGYSDARIFLLVFTQSVLLCVLAALLGLVLGHGLFPGLKSIFHVDKMPVQVFIEGGLLAIALSLLIGIIPAMRAKRVDIVEVLRSC